MALRMLFIRCLRSLAGRRRDRSRHFLLDLGGLGQAVAVDVLVNGLWRDTEVVGDLEDGEAHLDQLSHLLSGGGCVVLRHWWVARYLGTLHVVNPLNHESGKNFG